MPETDDRILRLTQAILADGKAEADRIIDEAEQNAALMLEQARRQFDAGEGDRADAEMQSAAAGYSKKMSSKDFETHKMVLSHRNKLVDELFLKAEQRIKGYSGGAEYKALVFSLIDKANAEKPFYDGCEVYLCDADSELFADIAKKYPVKTLKSGDIKLGGAVIHYPEENIYIDYTVDCALEKQRRSFADHKELTL